MFSVIASSILVPFVLPIAKNFVSKISEQSGLYIMNTFTRDIINQVVDTQENPNDESFFKNIFKNDAKKLFENGILSTIYLGVGKYIYNEYQKSISKTKTSTVLSNWFAHSTVEKQNIVYFLIGLFSLMVYHIGETEIIREIEKILEKEKDLKIQEGNDEGEIALGILKHVIDKKNKIDQNWIIYNYILKKYYLNNEYYTSHSNQILKYFSLSNIKNIHPVRILYNCLFGFSSILENFLGSSEPESLKKSTNLLSLLLDIELFTLVLKIENWSPFYNLIKHIKGIFINYEKIDHSDSFTYKSKLQNKNKHSNPWIK